MKALCPFREKYAGALKKVFSGIEFVIVAHEQHASGEEFRERVKNSSASLKRPCRT